MKWQSLDSIPKLILGKIIILHLIVGPSVPLNYAAVGTIQKDQPTRELSGTPHVLSWALELTLLSHLLAIPYLHMLLATT